MSAAVEQEQVISSPGPVLQSLIDLTIGFPAGTVVALSEERKAVVAFGKDAETVYTEARENGEEHPLMWQVPEPNVFWA